MNYQLLFIILITLVSCHQAPTSAPTQTISPGYEQLLEAKETAAAQSDPVGELIATIDFKLKANKEDLDIFEDGIVPWISLEKPGEEISRLIDGDETVLLYLAATLIIDYPLNQPALFELTTSETGFTRKQLIGEISKRYHAIYQEEEKTATVKTVPIDKREGIINRNETNGKYGVWGHDLSDLVLNAVEVYKDANGKISLILSVES